MRVLVIYKRSTFDQLTQHKRSSLHSFLERGGRSAEQIVASHNAHKGSLEAVRQTLKRLGVQAAFRHRLEADQSAECDLLVTVGGDGTLLWASHLVGSATPMLAINSAPQASVGYFCAADVSTLEDTLRDAIAGRIPATPLARMQIERDGELLTRRVLNDVLICHLSPAATSRYVLRWRGVDEEQKSSGLWVGPAAGSTAAQHSAGGVILPLTSQELQFVVREPYIPAKAPIRLTRGLIPPGEVLAIHSLMDAGRVYVDGCRRFHTIELGAELRMRLSPEPLTLLGMRPHPAA